MIFFPKKSTDRWEGKKKLKNQKPSYLWWFWNFSIRTPNSPNFLTHRKIFLHFLTYVEIKSKTRAITYKSFIEIKDPKWDHSFSFHFISQPLVKPASQRASQPVEDQPEGRRSAATRLVPPFLSNLRSRAMEWVWLERYGKKGMEVPARLVPALSLLTSYPLVGRQLAGWLAWPWLVANWLTGWLD